MSSWQRTLQTIGQKKAKDYRLVKKSLTNQLRASELDIQNHPTCNHRATHVALAREALRKHQQVKIHGAMVRARSHWLQFGDKGSKFFFNLLKLKQSKERIDRLIIDNKEIIDLPSITNAFELFYKNLFTSEDSAYAKNIREKCKSMIPTRISPEDSIPLNQKVSIEEISAAINSLNSDKALGPDGLPIEFYKANIEWIAIDLHDVYFEAFDNGSLGTGINKGTIKLIPKEGDRALIKNWRPITLLNASYKILAKVIALRLEKLLPNSSAPPKQASSRVDISSRTSSQARKLWTGLERLTKTLLCSYSILKKPMTMWNGTLSS